MSLAEFLNYRFCSLDGYIRIQYRYCSGVTVLAFILVEYCNSTVCALIFAGFMFRGFAIFAFFAFLNSQLLGTVVLKYSRVKYSRIYASESVYLNSIQYLQRWKTCWTRCWIRLKMSSNRMESCIRGFHVYEEVWTPFIGERLGCAGERSNREDPFAVAMKRGTETVGHVPRTISCICALFLRQCGSISCEVTGSSRPSIDLSPF